MNQETTTQNIGTTNQSKTEGLDAANAETKNAFQKLIDSVFGEKSQEDKGEETKEDKGDTVNKASYSKEEMESYFEKKLAQEQAKWSSQQEEKEKLSKLTPEERAKVEGENSNKRIEELEKKLMQKELYDVATQMLSKGGYPIELASLINYTSKENMDKSLESVKTTFAKCLESTIKEKLKGKTPVGLGAGATAENAIKDQIAKNIRGGL